MEEKQTMGKRIAELRKQAGLTQEQLGEKLGVSAQAVSKWENDISYPDITLLPLLAEQFGVTLDELMGVKPVDPKVIILDKEESTNSRNKGTFTWEWHQGKWSTIAFCIGLILICLFFLLHSVAGLFPYIKNERINLGAWGYLWPLLVFTGGLIVVRGNIAMGAVLLLYGAYEFVRRALLPYGHNLFEIPWYVLLLVFAIFMLVRTIWRTAKGKHDGRYHNEKHPPVMEINQTDSFLHADMSFGSGMVAYTDPVLRGGDIDSSFGEYTIDFTGVQKFTDGCLLKVDNSFGSVKILLPGTVRLVKSAENAFASFAVKGEPLPDATQELIIKSDASFGSVQVIYK